MSTKIVEADVINNERESRYEIRVGDDVAVVEYELDGPEITFTHTEVPEVFEGKGVASRLVRAALDDAQRRGLQVIPACSYVESWIERHPEYADLVPAKER